MIAIQSKENRISFLEFTLEIPKDLIHALQIYAKVKNGKEEKTRNEWLEIYKAMLNKKTN